MPKLTTYQTGALFLIIAFITLFLKSSFAQTSDEKSTEAVQKLIHESDSVYGSHHELVNGEIYYQSNLYAEGNPFYLSDDWVTGSVVVNGKTHENVSLKYNIVTDQLILRPTIKNGMSTIIVLNTPFVESFSLADNHFENAENLGSSIIKSNFVHDIYSDSFRFLATYKVNFVKEYNEKTPYGKYSRVISSYFILDNGSITKITSKKALSQYFEPYKKEIKKHMKKMKFRFKKANAMQWKELMSFIDGLTKKSQE